jgi:hypothetical protein
MELEMDGGIRRIAARTVVAALSAVALVAVTASAASAEVVYDNAPSPLPANFASIGLAATSTSEFGGEVELAGTARARPTVTVVMSSWACEEGTWTTSCTTKKRKGGFKVPVTIRVYGVDELTEVPLAERTKTFKMRYRPSDSPGKCAAHEWYDEATSECSHGYAFPIAMKLPKLKKMPLRTVITVSYPHESGPAASLNVSVSEPWEETLSIGAQPVEEWFADSTSSEMYCPGAKDIGTLGPEEGVGCQEGIDYQPVFEVSAQ